MAIQPTTTKIVYFDCFVTIKQTFASGKNDRQRIIYTIIDNQTKKATDKTIFV